MTNPSEGTSDPASRRLLVRIAAVVVVLLVAVANPPMRAHLKGALLTAQLLPGPIRPLGWLTPDPRRSEVRLPSTDADAYTPRGFSRSPGIVLLHGAAEPGKDDSRIVELATAISRTGRRVLVPNLELRHERVDPEDRRRIADAVEHLSGDRRRVGIFGISYGAGLALVALADDPRLQDRVAFVATMGTYYDLAHLVRGVTTGVVPVGDELVAWEAHPEGRDILAEQIAFLLPDPAGDALRTAWGRGDPEGLPPDARAAFDLLRNRDPARFDDLLARLPSDLLDLLEELSPSRITDDIRVPVYALHSTDDPAAPPTESRLLVDALDEHVEARHYEVTIFEHATPRGSPFRALGDGRRIAAFAGRILRAQEGWPRF